MSWEKILKEDESVEEEEFVHYIKADGSYLVFDYIYDGKKVSEEIAHTISWLAKPYSDEELAEVYAHLIGMGFTIKLAR